MTIIRVPLDKTTIQEGVQAAKPGDVVLVRRGIYKESVTITSSFIRIEAENKNEAVLQGSGMLANGFLLDHVTDVEVTGFKIQNYLLNGIFVNAGGFHRLFENSCISNGLAGIGLAGSGNFVWNNRLQRNSCAGVWISADNNWLYDNVSTKNGTDGVSILSGTHNALISNKVMHSMGGAGVSIIGLQQHTLLYENELLSNLQGVVVYNEPESMSSEIASNNEVKRNKLANLVLVHAQDPSMSNKLVYFIEFASTLSEMAQQLTAHLPERKRNAQAISLNAFHHWLEQAAPARPSITQPY